MPRIMLEGMTLRVASTAWVAPGATLVGSVDIRSGASVWYSAVVRGDGDHIVIGADSNIQDGCVLHADSGLPVLVGSGVSVGHRAVLHGCRVDDDVLIGMGSVVLNGAHIGSGSLVAAGTIVLEGTDVPPDSLVAGVPGKVRRATTSEERSSITHNAHAYVELMARHRDGTLAEPAQPSTRP
jgi:carbonic anhydrase/acetyltransferase-like protein (isoleucine patch superfamily)